MKKLILLASCAALWACADNAAEEETVAEENAVAVDETAMAEDSAPEPVSYSWAGENGEAMVMSIDAEGNYIIEADGEHLDHGTVSANDAGKACFTSEMDQPTSCWTQTDLEVGGSQETTSDDGMTVTVTRTEYVELAMPGA